MLIDWFTVAAQIVNFLLLVWLLQRFLYKPVLAAIDAREKRIAEQLTRATERETQAQQERDRYHGRNEEIESQKEGLLRAAAEAATAERQRLLEAAHHDADALRTRLTHAVAEEQDELSRRLREQAQEEVLAIARKTLHDLAGVELEERIIEAFIDRLRRLQPHAADTPGSPASGAVEALVRSGFELSTAQQAALQAAVRAHFGAATAVRFERATAVLCGIELTADGVKLAWSIADYLDSLARLTAATAGPGATAAAPTVTANAS
ncbi:MAG TPA: hypothetical protein VHB68_05740 [Steroidobacteraceae bacterium]|nr:hypothetical protein [Steroidobacteraceae bacterium]